MVTMWPVAGVAKNYYTFEPYEVRFHYQANMSHESGWLSWFISNGAGGGLYIKASPYIMRSWMYTCSITFVVIGPCIFRWPICLNWERYEAFS